MRNLKKFLALVLAMMMACSLVVTGSAAKWNSSAGDFDDQSGVTPAFEEGVAVVTGMKIFKGDAGTNDFRPAASIKRSEVAAIVYRLVTGDVNDDSAYLYTHVAPFTDVNPTDWFAGYVGYLWNAEIIKGSNTERTQFNPYGEVTGYEALAMVLRAMGYDENDEFTGAGWQIRVGQTANNRNLLANVNTTNYGAGHLNAAARRDTVAEIIFQAATKATVTYTPAFGYHTTEITVGRPVDNTSLGYANFNLTCDLGIVTGNQATGETATKMTFEVGKANGDGSGQRIINDSYIYGGVYDDSDSDDAPTSVNRNFNHTTGLDQFGHANKVWYSDVPNGGGVGKFKTYAWIDKATHTQTVRVDRAMDNAELKEPNSLVALAAEDAGFAIKTNQAGDTVIAFASNKYDRMGPVNAAAAALKGDTASVTKEAIADKTDVESPDIWMYSLVSNSADKSLDVIISLDAEVARIYDTDSTSSKDRIVLLNSTLGQTGTDRPGGHILVDHLTPNSVQTLGTNVEAWVVDGTTKPDSDAEAPNHDINSLYETIAVKNGPSGMVGTIDGDGTVTMANGQQIKKSYLYDVVMEGSVSQEGITAGVELSFVLDQWGRYLGVSSDPGYKFIYTTFADHSYGDVGSADLKYLVYGVDQNGGKIVDQPLTEMAQGAQSYNPEFKALNGEVFNTIEVARRDYGLTSVGNQVAEGVYRGGVITADGTWWVNNEADPVNYGYRTLEKDNYDWSFTSTDVTKGFKDVTKAGDPDIGKLLLTPNTVFYVVSGTGTASLDVKIYNGMEAFLDGASKVSIDPAVKNHDIDEETYDVVYMTTADTYNSVGNRTTQNGMVTKVFLSAKAVSRENTATMFYAHCSEPTDLKIAGYEDAYSQYELWQGSTKGSYFITVDDTINADKFYSLVKTGTKNGIDVYTAREIVATRDSVYTDGGSCWTQQPIDYFATNDTSTARIGDTLLETVYRVDNATVVDLTTSQARHDAGDSHASHNEIKSVKDLFNAISVGFKVEVSIVNTGVNTSLIYVIDIVAPY